MASDSGKDGVARLAGIEAPGRLEARARFAASKEGRARRSAVTDGIDPAGLRHAAQPVFPNGRGDRFTGQARPTGFAPACAIWGGAGVSLGTPDSRPHRGPPSLPATKQAFCCGT